jgi:hypothetical protein
MNATHWSDTRTFREKWPELHEILYGAAGKTVGCNLYRDPRSDATTFELGWVSNTGKLVSFSLPVNKARDLEALRELKVLIMVTAS